MLRIHVFYFISICSLILSCQSSSTKTQVNPEQTQSNDSKPFFDLRGYFLAEIDTLEMQQKKVNKKVTVDGEIELKNELTVAFKDDLKVFIESDINKPAWFGKYTIDSTANQISYIASDDGLKIRNVNILLNTDGTINELSIVRKRKSIVASVSQNLVYLPRQSYLIESIQEQAGGAKQSVQILGKIID